MREDIEGLIENELRYEEMEEDFDVVAFVEQLENISDQEFFYLFGDEKIYQ